MAKKGYTPEQIINKLREAELKLQQETTIAVDSMVIFHQRERRDLETAYRKYCGGELENAHCAEEDAKAAAEVLDRQLEMYGDLTKDMASLGALCYEVREDYVDTEGRFIWVDGEAVCNFSTV
jgi:DNA polymerase-3 subunit epsilon